MRLLPLSRGHPQCRTPSGASPVSVATAPPSVGAALSRSAASSCRIAAMFSTVLGSSTKQPHTTGASAGARPAGALRLGRLTYWRPRPEALLGGAEVQVSPAGFSQVALPAGWWRPVRVDAVRTNLTARLGPPRDIEPVGGVRTERRASPPAWTQTWSITIRTMARCCSRGSLAQRSRMSPASSCASAAASSRSGA